MSNEGEKLRLRKIDELVEKIYGGFSRVAPERIKEHFGAQQGRLDFREKPAEMNVEKLQKMAGTVRTGGKGTVRRKKKAVHKTASTDEKKVNSTLKRIGVNTIPGIEEVLIVNEDGTALAFNNPKVQASIAANTYVVSGPSQQKSADEVMASMLPAGMTQASLQQMLAQMQMGGLGAGAEEEEEGDDDDDDVPDLVENFDQAQ